MNIPSRKNLLLVELILVILFFAISAAVTLELFSLAHQRVGESARLTDSLMAAQNWAERISIAGDPEALLIEAGWTREGDEYRLGEMTIVAVRSGQPQGVLIRFEIAAPPVLLPIERYLPREEAGL